jgi:hypothetical protein
VLPEPFDTAAGLGEAVAGGFDAALAHLGGDHLGVPADTEFLYDEGGEIAEVGFEF